MNCDLFWVLKLLEEEHVTNVLTKDYHGGWQSDSRDTNLGHFKTYTRFSGLVSSNTCVDYENIGKLRFKEQLHLDTIRTVHCGRGRELCWVE